MTEGETKILTEVANDVKWLKKSVEENASAHTNQLEIIAEKLSTMNGTVHNNTTWVCALRWVVAVIITGMVTMMGYFINHIMVR